MLTTVNITECDEDINEKTEGGKTLMKSADLDKMACKKKDLLKTKIFELDEEFKNNGIYM
jgi:formate-dependent nitrite reductase cytochrome c552 subunit